MRRLRVPSIESIDSEMADQYQREVCMVMEEPWFKALHPAERTAFLVIGLSQEAGEVQEVFKKAIPFTQLHDKAHITEELGDTLWHIATVAEMEGVSLADVMRASLRKFRDRYPHRYEEV